MKNQTLPRVMVKEMEMEMEMVAAAVMLVVPAAARTLQIQAATPAEM